MDDWLKQRADALAAASGIDRAALDLSDADARALLALAKTAAHESGARTNAPLLCYLVGVARAGGLSVDELADAIQ
ncbi:MAG: hypothetical protein QOD43_1417 [Gaiellaceae bacterium]|nr:hypothetical protein [Gaiellaceae bacterium]